MANNALVIKASDSLDVLTSSRRRHSASKRSRVNHGSNPERFTSHSRFELTLDLITPCEALRPIGFVSVGITLIAIRELRKYDVDSLFCMCVNV